MTIKDDPSIFLPLAEELANSKADELEVKGQLHTPRKQYVEQKTSSITQALEGQYTKLLHRMESISAILQEELNLLPKAEKEHHEKEFSLAHEKLEQLKIISVENLKKDDTYQDLLALSDETLLWIYKIGHRYYEQKKLEEALTFFQLLVSLNPLVCDYWIALGFSQRSLSLTEEALNSFAMAILLNQENPIPRYQSAELYLQTGEFDEALIELDALLKIIQEQKLDSLKSNVEILRNKAKNKQSL